MQRDLGGYQVLNHTTGQMETMLQRQALGSELSPASRASEAAEGTVKVTEVKVRTGPGGHMVGKWTADPDEWMNSNSGRSHPRWGGGRGEKPLKPWPQSELYLLVL